MNDSMIISDELLAAFLDGNTSAEDTMRVLKAAEQDEELRELIRIVSEVDEDMAGRKPAKVKELPMTAMAARKKESYLCDIECEEFVLHQLGIETTHKTLLDEAYRNCWLRDKGMPLYNIGRLLEKNNLAVSRRYDSSIEDVVRWLEHGDQLIAVVDSTMLESATSTSSQTYPNHAVAYLLGVCCVKRNNALQSLYRRGTDHLSVAFVLEGLEAVKPLFGSGQYYRPVCLRALSHSS